jgi:hypothetical protein
MPAGWKGDLDGIVPSSFKKLTKLQKKWGLVEPRRYRMCLGIEDCAHEPLIFGPIEEDKYEHRKVVQCNCQSPQDKLKCQQCAPKCNECNTVRAELIPFDFLPPADILASPVTSNIFCQQMLAM